MNLDAIQSKLPAAAPAADMTSDVPMNELVGNKSLTEHQKIAEASRQFEAILLRQILSEAEKPVIKSEFTDNSTAAGIYQDFITNQLSESLSKSGAFGFAKVFDRQLDRADQSNSPETKAAQAAGHDASHGVSHKYPLLTHTHE